MYKIGGKILTSKVQRCFRFPAMLQIYFHRERMAHITILHSVFLISNKNLVKASNCLVLADLRPSVAYFIATCCLILKN